MRNVKRIIMFAIALMLLPIPINALYGGGTINYSFTSCQNLTVNITNSQMEEWSASPNCTEETAGNFYCNCSDNWTIYLTPAANAVGNYTITMTSSYSAETQNVVVNSGGGGGYFGCKKEDYYCSPTQQCCAGLTCQNDICVNISTNSSTTTTAVPTTTTTTTTVPTTTTTTTPPATNPITGFATFVSSPSGISLLLSIIIAAILIIIFYKKWYVPRKIKKE